MNEQDLKQFKDTLETNLAKLTEQLSTSGRKLNEAGDWITVPAPMDTESPEPNEIASVIEEFEGDIAVMNVLEEQYADIKDALTRIENGTYGQCKEGGHLIEVERLKAIPSTDTCLAHKEN